jgi:hypothetical protein
MRAQRITAWFFRLGIGLFVICAVLAFFNLFDSNPRASRNAVELFATGAGLYLVAVLIGWLTAKVVSRSGEPDSN